MSPSVKLPIACLIFSTFPYTGPSWALCMLLSDVFCSTESFVYVCLRQARYRKEQVLPKMVPWIPPVDNLLKDSTDGCALAALLHFYCPAIICLGGTETCQTLNITEQKILCNTQREQCAGAVKSKPTIFTYTCCYCTQFYYYCTQSSSRN